MDYDAAVLHYGALVAELVSPTGDVATAVAAFTAPVESVVATTAAGKAAVVVEGMLWAGWEAVVGATRDADEDAIARLVALVTGVRNRTVTDPGGREFLVVERRVFAELPVFGMAMREAWNADPEDAAAALSWTRVNAFAAQLTAAGVDFSLYGLWSIGTALETFAEVSIHLPPAVQWFKHCGPELVSATLHGRTFGTGPGRLHELAVGSGLSEGGFNVPRWMFWRSRLDGLARAGDRTAREGLRYVRQYDARIAAG